MSLSGCALTHEQVVERAHKKTNTELCMALIQFPQYADVVQAELDDRGRVCDLDLAAAQVREQGAKQARLSAALMAASANAAPKPTYQVVQPAPLVVPPSIQAAPLLTGATAYFTGSQKQVQTVTNQFGWNCEYRYNMQTFWRTFVGSCPANIQVQ